MCELKCPICNSNLIITRLCDEIFPNPNKGKIDEIFCDKCKMHGTEELWQELIRTRKALDVAVDALDRMAIDDNVSGMIARNAIKEIKALEQKDVK